MTVTFAQTVGALYGDLVDADALSVIAKLDDPSSYHVPGTLKIARKRKVTKASDQTKRKVTAGLSAVGAGAGGLGLAVGAKEVRRHGWKATPKLTRALIPVEVAGLAGEVSATRILHGDTKRKVTKGMRELIDGHKASLRRQTSVHPPVAQAATVADRAAGVGNKNLPAATTTDTIRTARSLAGDAGKATVKGGRRVAAAAGTPKGRAALVAGGAVAYGHERGKRKQAEAAYGKRDIEIAGTFSKFDDDKQRAYGWASVTEVEGVPVIDRQGDMIDLEDLEEAAYVYVRKSRITGDMHRRTHDDLPHKVGELIESVVFTPDKCEAMGVPKSLVGKWWMGVEVADDELWAEVKKGNRTGFSIHGRGIRKATSLDELMNERGR